MIPVAFLALDYFGEKKVFNYFKKNQPIDESVGKAERKINEVYKVVTRKVNNFFSGLFKFFKYIFYFLILILVIIVVYYFISIV